MSRPKHIDGNTSLIWMYERSIKKNPDWCLEGLMYQETDESGLYQGIQLSDAFEIHEQLNQVIILHHPKYTRDQLKPHVKKKIMTRYENLNLEY
jgi:hypothetical protein